MVNTNEYFFRHPNWGKKHGEECKQLSNRDSHQQGAVYYKSYLRGNF